MKYQIHVAGAKRAGKTTLANNLMVYLRDKGFDPQLVDVDEVKFKLFGSNTGVPDSPESLKYHGATLKTMTEILIPTLLDVGRVPVVVATHSSPRLYEDAKKIAENAGAQLKFLIVEAPTLEEAAERSLRAGPEDRSDMKDFTNPAIRESFVKNAEKMQQTYKGVNDPRVYWVKQATQGEMLAVAAEFIFKGSQ